MMRLARAVVCRDVARGGGVGVGPAAAGVAARRNGGLRGARRGWDAEITEQIPDERVAWTSREGTRNAGAVTFHRLDDTTTRVMLQLDVEPEGLIEQAGDKLGFIRRRATGDLQRFKDFIEARGHETGAWRGEVRR